jgi:uncharacterized protein YuzE
MTSSNQADEQFDRWIDSLDRDFELTVNQIVLMREAWDERARLSSPSVPEGWQDGQVSMRRVTGPDEHGSVYVYFQEPRSNAVAQTVPLQRESIDGANIDFDKDGKLYGIEILGVSDKITRPLRRAVPVGEQRWLIEGTAYYPTRRCFWTGSFWADDFHAEEPPALKAARYWSKESAEATIKTISSISADNVHNIEAIEHMFQCGTTADQPPSAPPEAGKVQYVFDRFRRGQIMAEGIVVHASSLEEAYRKASKMMSKQDSIRLRESAEPPSAQGEAEIVEAICKINAHEKWPADYDRRAQELRREDARKIYAVVANALRHPSPVAQGAGAEWISVPPEATAENGLKALLIGEFYEEYQLRDELGGESTQTVAVSWTTIKDIYRRAVAHFAPPKPTAREGGEL